MCDSLRPTLDELVAEPDPVRLTDKLLRALLLAAGCGSGALYLLSEGVGGEPRLQLRLALPADSSPALLPLSEEGLWARCLACGRPVGEKDLALPLPGTGDTVIGVVLLYGGGTPEKDALCRLEQLALYGGASLSRALREEDFHGQLWRFIETFVSEMDAARRFHPRHTRNMAALAEKFLDYLEARGEPVAQRETFLLAVWLHDIGKLAVPSEVLDKNGRMSPQELRSYCQYLECVRLEKRLHWANSNRFRQEDRELPQRNETLALLAAINWSPRLTEYQRMELEKLADFHFRNWRYKRSPWFTARQYACLSIPEGILTPDEKAAFESHAAETANLLEKLRLLPQYQMAAQWAADHHERLDGSGYPLHLRGDEIARETRILSILDVYETLTGRNSWTYPAQTQERALNELRRQAAMGMLDAKLVAQFAEAVTEAPGFPPKDVEN